MSHHASSVSWEVYIPVPDTPAEHALNELQSSMPSEVPAEVRSLILERAGQVTNPEAVLINDRRKTPFGPILYAGGDPKQDRCSYSVEAEIKQLEGWSGLSIAALKLFPFAINTGRGRFCIDFRDAAKPIVFVDFDYDLEEKGAIQFVARNLDDLYSQLR